MTTTNRQPNVLFILSDQHNAKVLGHKGHPDVQTPNLDRMAAEGVRFDNAITQNPICTPSRVSWLSGQYCHNHGYYGLSGPEPRGLPTVLGHFRKAGYRTAAIGKIHCPENWVENDSDLFHETGGCSIGGRSGEYVAYLEEKGLSNLEDHGAMQEFGKRGQQTVEGRPSKVSYEDGQEGWSVRKATEFMEQCVTDGVPFFTHVSLPKPHQCYTPAKEFWDLYDESTLTLPPNADYEMKDKAPHLRQSAEGWRNREWQLFEPKTFEAGRLRKLHGYLGNISHVDHAVGELLDWLDENNQSENTIVVYSSDHGDYACEHGIMEKAPGICSDAITRIPMFGHKGGESMYRNIHTAPRITGAAVIMIMAASSLPAQEKSMSMKPLEIGTRLELFVDDHLVERMTGVAFRLHAPVRQAPAKSPLPSGAYGTIIKDGDLYRAYYRSDIPGYDKGRQERNADNEPNEITCYAESRDGIEWTFPDLGITDIQSSKGGNVILARQSPFTHNFSPFLDTRPGVGPDARYKALAGSGESGLVAFKSADGIHWSKIPDAPVVKTPSKAPGSPWPFDSQNLAFWSEAENCYVAFVRTWGVNEPFKDDPDYFKRYQRRISRATSPDFITWTPLADTGANLPLEQLYTNQTHPYFRAPHIYIATMMRFTLGMERGEPVEGNNGSSDIVLMTMRAGSTAYQRTFREAFIRPGLDPQRWNRKANSAWLNVVPTGDAEMSLYHVNGDRYTLRTDGFISVNAGADGGELRTKPLIFAGNALSVNFSTGAAGALRVEIQDAAGQALPGFGLEDCQALIGDAIERQVRWKNNPDLAAIAGKPVRLRFALREGDVYSFHFRKQ